MKPEYFEEAGTSGASKESVTLSKIQDYYKKYNKQPLIADIRLLIEADNSISEKNSEAAYEFLSSLKKVEPVSEEVLIPQTEEFVTDSAVRIAILDSLEIMKKKNVPKGVLVDKFKEATSIEFDVKLGHDYFQDAQQRMESYLEEEDKIPLDVELLNAAMGGGLARKAIFLFLANTNVGKCQKFDTKVLMVDGSYKTIEWLYNNRQSNKIITMNSNHKLEAAEISDWYDSGVIDTYRLETKDGIYTEPSSTHPYYTLDGWKPVTELKVGDKIAIVKNYSVFDQIDNNLTEEEAELIGLLLSDGSIIRNFGFSNIDEELLNLFKKDVMSIHAESNFRYESNTLYASNELSHKNPLIAWGKEKGIFGLSSHTKRIPDCIFETSKTKIAKFIGAFYACDGWVSKRKGAVEVGLCLCNKDMITQVRSLLLRFGIKTRITSTSSTSSKGGKRFKSYNLVILDYKSIKAFYDNIHIPLKHKQEKLAVYIEEFKGSGFRNSYSAAHPKELWQYIKPILKERGMSISELGRQAFPEKVKKVPRPNTNSHRLTRHYFRSNSNISHQLLIDINRVLEDPFLQSLIEGDIYFDEITKHEYIGKHQCYDLTIPETHNFIANDTVVHNTVWLCHCASSLVRSGYNVLFVTAEMSEKEINKRVDCNLLDIPIDTLSPKIDKEQFKTNFKKLVEKTHGQLIVHETSPGKMNAHHIKNLIHELKLKKGYVPDVIVLDHITLFASYRLPASQTGTHLYVTAVMEEVRGVLKEENVSGLSATQLNRGAKAKGKDSGNEDVGLGYGISQTSDWSGTVSQTPELKEQNKYILSVAKTRYGSNNGAFYSIGIKYENMRLYNLDESEQEIPIHIKDQLKFKMKNETQSEDAPAPFDFS